MHERDDSLGPSAPSNRYDMTMLEWSSCPAVERDADRVSGAWVFRGTRVPVAALFENLEDGALASQFVDWFPWGHTRPGSRCPGARGAKRPRSSLSAPTPPPRGLGRRKLFVTPIESTRASGRILGPRSRLQVQTPPACLRCRRRDVGCAQRRTRRTVRPRRRAKRTPTNGVSASFWTATSNS